MKVTRVFAGEDGRSHFEELDVPLHDRGFGQLSEVVPITGVIFRSTPAEGVLDFHTAPRRQFVVTLSGGVEVECGDGSVRRFGPGDVMLADDTTGQGHISREVGGVRRSLFLLVPEELDVSAWRSS
ncbi:MAG TPA: hypothetical protein VKQ71_01630 [Acidimicrobiales bacterium]|nr:hypothetical protein [Acidimicrobiales bacterium]